jgi:hypothetical protein
MTAICFAWQRRPQRTSFTAQPDSRNENRLLRRKCAGVERFAFCGARQYLGALPDQR